MEGDGTLGVGNYPQVERLKLESKVEGWWCVSRERRELHSEASEPADRLIVLR